MLMVFALFSSSTVVSALDGEIYTDQEKIFGRDNRVTITDTTQNFFPSSEKDYLVNVGWRYEGVAFKAN